MANSVTKQKTDSMKGLSKDAQKRLTVLDNEVSNVNQSMLKIAFQIHWIYEHTVYQDLGYNNIYDFVNERYGMSRGSCSNYINVINRYCKRNDEQVLEELEEQFLPYTFSQLVVMIDLSNEEINKISPDTSVRNIQKQIRELMPKSNDKSDDASVSDDVIDVEAVEVNRQLLIQFRTPDDFINNIESIKTQIATALDSSDKSIEIACIW